MTRRLIIFFLSVLSFQSANCQDTLKNADQILDIAVTINFNATKFDNGSFINSLKQQNLPLAFNNETFGFSSAFYLAKLRRYSKLIPAIGLAVMSEKKSAENISVNATAVSNDYNMYYVAWHHKEQYFYPGIGFGWMQYKYDFVNHSNLPNSYPDALAAFNGERNIQSAGLTYLNLAANYDFSIDKSNEFFLGVRIDYHLGLNNKNMQLSDGSDLAQSPKLRSNAFSVGIALTVQ